MVHGGAPLIDISGTVSPTNSIDGTGVTVTIDGNEGMPALGLTVLEELSTNPALPPSTTAINQADVESTEDIADGVEVPPLCPHCAPNLLSLEAINRAISALGKQIGAFTRDISKMQDTVNLLSWHVSSSISKLTNKVRLAKESITNMSKSVNLGVEAHQRVQDIEASQDDTRRDINALLDTQVQDTTSLGQDIDAMNPKFETICDDLWVDIMLLWQNANAQLGLTNTGTPNTVSSSSPMGICNQSATPQLIHCDTWAQQSYKMPDPIRTHVPVNQQTFDF